MGKIGNFGSLIIFETSDARILQPRALKKEVSGRWAEHARIGKKPLKQFLGPGAEKVTFSITLDARHGVKPRKVIENIEKHIQKGTPKKLAIGGQVVVSNKLVITAASESWDEIWDKGELVRASLDLTLEEYPT